jgi:hypothetical protein
MFSQSTNGGFQWFNAPSGTADNAITFTQAMTLDASGNLGVGTTAIASGGAGTVNVNFHTPTSTSVYLKLSNAGTGNTTADGFDLIMGTSSDAYLVNRENGPMIFFTNATERARIDSSGNLLVGTTSTTPAASNVTGVAIRPGGNSSSFTGEGGSAANFNRKSNDGTVIFISQDGTAEGDISVSGTTVSYNGGHLSRYAQTADPKDDTLLKGTVLSNLDEMNVYTDADGNPVDNEQLNKVKVSDVEGDANVAGVFVNWTHDDVHNVDEINMAMTGDMIIRIAQGVTVARGDLLMSAGDGTAKPQGDDIVRSKTVAKVTSAHVTCTYADGSYCVPCVLMAC